ncbi:MAG: putative hydro-lyase [Spirochaetales bacterium]|nr:putative hydro-lyase [Spirochaetales bacterium]
MFKTGKELRDAIRNGRFTGPTAGQAKGYVQANLAVLPKDWAYDFLLFAQRNPKPCPLLEVGETGSPFTPILAEGADIRTDIPRYFVYEKGVKTAEKTDISGLWSEDYVYFLLGCSFSFEQALLAEGLEIRHITENRNVPMYVTNIMCRDAGRFTATPMVVSMRPFSPDHAEKAAEITRYYPAVHGSPVHMGDPAAIGIKDISTPDFGDSVTLKEGEVPVFWACGVTPQMAAAVARPPVMITHAPGHMFVGDLHDSDFRI